MFGDTISMQPGSAATPNGPAKVLVKKGSNKPSTTEYYLNDGTERWFLTIRHSVEGTPRANYKPVERHTLVFRDELNTGAIDDPFGIREVTVIIRNNVTDNPAFVQDIGQAVGEWLLASSGANLLKMIGNE